MAMKPEHSIVVERSDRTRDSGCTYAIRVRGRLDHERWSQWFDGMTITVRPGETLISGQVPDQAALYGMLARLRDLALPLLSVERLGGDAGHDLVRRSGVYWWRLRGRINWPLVLLYLLLAGGASALVVYSTSAGLLHTALALGLLFAGLAASAYGLLKLDRGWGWRLVALINGLAAAISLSIYTMAAGWLPVALGLALMLFVAAGLIAYLVYRTARNRHAL
jgi:hypothetical protein